MKPKNLVRAGVLLAILGPTVHAMIPSGIRSRSPHIVPTETRAPETGVPILRSAPASVNVTGDGPHPVVITGDGFDASLTVTMRSHLWEYTFGPNSNVSRTSFELDLASVEDGTYVVSVTNGSGLKSNAVPMTIRRTPGPQ